MLYVRAPRYPSRRRRLRHYATWTQDVVSGNTYHAQDIVSTRKMSHPKKAPKKTPRKNAGRENIYWLRGEIKRFLYRVTSQENRGQRTAGFLIEYREERGQ